MIIYVWIVCLLFMGFLLLFGRMRWLEKLWELLHRTREGMDRASQLRAVENRHRLMEFQQKNNVWYRIEEVLRYSGLRRRMPHFTAEKWVAGNVPLIAAVEMILLNTFRFLEYRSVNDNILKCLNFLGNYSLTAGEITGVLGQVSKYMEEPLKGVMEECAYEAQMTGNSSTALLAMAEKVEHPKFKELARNLEISIRYMADLTTLVDSSRRSVREYLRTEEERKGMLREAAINMGLLAAMSVFALMTVDRLIDVSVWKIVTDTLPGHLALGIYGIIFGLFLRKVYGFRR